MQVILVRHGETEYNAQGRLQGYSPVPLSTRGRQQAMLVGPRVQSLCPTVLYSSDIQRAHETATILSEHVGLPVQPCPGLREWNIGNWIDRMMEDFYAHLTALGAHPATHVPEGGESQVQTQARMVAQMQAWADQHAGATILGVSHGTAIDLLVRHILGLDVRQSPHIASRTPPSTSFATSMRSGKSSRSTISGISHPWRKEPGREGTPA